VDEVEKHGGDIYSYIEKYGIEPLDYSANINPLGLPVSVKRALSENVGSFSAYPDIHCRKLKEAVGIHENIKQDSIMFGNGAADIIFRICYTLMPKTALLTAPTF
jgi:threonine-phosphate decarboxylase